MRFPVLVPLSLVLVAGCSHSTKPSAFLTKAIEGDNSEITLGALAAARGGPAVREYGRMLQSDHTKAKAAAVSVASKYGVLPTDKIVPEAAKEQQVLLKLSGNSFDKEFAAYMVKDHKSDISDFEKEVSSSAPDDVKALAKTTLPDLRNHLAVASKLT
jgi:putative membrane protein